MVKARTPLSKRNTNAVQRRPAAGKKPARATNWKARTSCVFAEPPSGCLFKTSFACKYYGKGATTIDASAPLTAANCVGMVRSVMTKAGGAGGPVSTTLSITDQGIDFEDRKTGDTYHHVPVRELFKIVPGTIVSKSGKSYTVTLVIEYDETLPIEAQPCHVFQCAHAEDAAHMHDASKRMWRDHLFSNLLDVSTEEAQDGFDSFMIRQDMENAARRCSEVLEQDARKANDRCSTLLETDLQKGFNFLDFIGNGAV